MIGRPHVEQDVLRPVLNFHDGIKEQRHDVERNNREEGDPEHDEPGELAGPHDDGDVGDVDEAAVDGEAGHPEVVGVAVLVLDAHARTYAERQRAQDHRQRRAVQHFQEKRLPVEVPVLLRRVVQVLEVRLYQRHVANR